MKRIKETDQVYPLKNTKQPNKNDTKGTKVDPQEQEAAKQNQTKGAKSATKIPGKFYPLNKQSLSLEEQEAAKQKRHLCP